MTRAPVNCLFIRFALCVLFVNFSVSIAEKPQRVLNTTNELNVNVDDMNDGDGDDGDDDDATLAQHQQIR